MLDSIDRDLKTALLAGDKLKSETLKSLKNALQYKAVATSQKLEDLNDRQIQHVLTAESKKRQEAADLYKKAGEEERAESELAEKAIIDAYLPEPLPEAEVAKVVTEEVRRINNPTMADMGKIIGAVKGRLGGQADGAIIARLTKQALENQ